MARATIPTEVWVLLVRRADIPYLNRQLAGLTLLERHVREALHWNVRQIFFWLEPPSMPHDQALKTEFERSLRRMEVKGDPHFVRVITRIDELTIHEAERAMAAPFLSLYSYQWMSKWSAALASAYQRRANFESIWTDVRSLPEVDEWKEARNATVFYIPLLQEKDWAWSQKRLGVEIVEQSRSGVLGKVFNRKVSLALSRILVQFDVPPMAWTWVNVAFGLGAAVLMMSSHDTYRLLGTLLFYWSCIFDGVDGEVARFRFETSPSGALFDMASSWFNTLLFYGAVILSLVATGELSVTAGRTVLTMSSALLVILSIYFNRVVRVPLGQGAWSAWEAQHDRELRSRWISLVFRKESFAFLTLILAFLGFYEVIAWGALAFLGLAWVVIADIEIRGRRLATAPEQTPSASESSFT